MWLAVLPRQRSVLLTGISEFSNNSNTLDPHIEVYTHIEMTPCLILKLKIKLVLSLITASPICQIPLYVRYPYMSGNVTNPGERMPQCDHLVPRVACY